VFRKNAFYYPKDLALPKFALNFAAENISFSDMNRINNVFLFLLA